MAFDDNGTFDVALGGDISTINTTISSVFGTIHDAILPHTFNVGQLNITAVTIDLQQPPVVSLAATQYFRDEATEWAQEHLADQDDVALGAIVERLLAGSFAVSCSQATALITYNDGTPSSSIPMTISMGAAVFVVQSPAGSGWLLQVQLSGASFDVASEPILDDLLDKIVGPALLSYLNNGVLAAISIPSISLPGASLTAPILSQEQGSAGDQYLVAYSGLSAVNVPDPGSDWPPGSVFVAVDENVINMVANAALPAPNGSWSGGPLEADYGVNLGAQVELTVGSGNEIGGTLQVNGGAKVCFITPNGLPNICIGGSITGTVGVSAAISAAPGANNSQVIQVQFLGINSPDLNIEIDVGILPVPIPVGPILDAVVAVISAAMSGLTVNVYTLPPILLGSIGLPNYAIVLQNLQLATNAGPAGLPMAMVTGQVGVVQTGAARACSSEAQESAVAAA